MILFISDPVLKGFKTVQRQSKHTTSEEINQEKEQFGCREEILQVVKVAH